MAADRAGTGPFISAIGAAVLAVSVFLPWYSLSITTDGAAAAQAQLDTVAREFGNATFQAQASTVGSGFSELAGRQLATVSAHQLLKDLSAVLLILAALSLLGALSRLAGSSAPLEAGGGQIALVGTLASLCVLYRMVELPLPQEAFVSLSLGWGVWLALVSSVAIVVGGLWPAPSNRSSYALPDLNQH